MAHPSQDKLRFVAGFSLFFVGLWLLWDTPVVYPLKIFVVLLHEVSHAIVSLATGGTVEAIVLDPAEGGACLCPGGNAFLTLSAGYLGSLLWGGVMIGFARQRRIKAWWVNGVIGALVIGLTLQYVRNGFGLVFGLAFGLAMIVLAHQLGETANRTFLLTLGLTSALYAILDIKSDVLDRRELLEQAEVRSDAHMLAEITGIPTAAWGVIWIGIALAFSFWLFRKAYRDA